MEFNSGFKGLICVYLPDFEQSDTSIVSFIGVADFRVLLGRFSRSVFQL